MKKSSTDITINVTAHAEGILLHKTLRSVWTGYEHAVKNGVKNIEFNISLDNADEQTTKVAEEFKRQHPAVILHKINVKDLGESRNYLINKSGGKYIVFFDGDDFFTTNYIYEAFSLAEKNKQPAVYSPAYLVSFEAHDYIIPKLESVSTEFKAINLFETNYFISQSFVSREVYEKIKYLPNSGGYGMEDWHWNTKVIFEGYQFYNVPDTIFFYRRKTKGSLILQQSTDKAMLRPTPLFEPTNFTKFKTYHIDKSQVNSAAAKQNLARRAKKTTVRILRKFMSGDSLIYRYMREQYLVNRAYAGALRTAVNHKTLWMKPKHNSDLYHDPLNIDTSIPHQLSAIGINETVLNEWAKMNAFEPMIRPSMGVLETLPIASYPTNSVMSTIYYEMCDKYGRQGFTDIVFLPHLLRGGADLAAINLVQALTKELGRKVLVCLTDGTESPWGEKIKDMPNAELIEFRDQLSKYLSPEQIEVTIAYLIKNWGIQRVSIINSAFGYDLAEHYGKQLRENTQIFLYTFAYDMTPDGFLFNYLKNGLVNLYNDIDLYFTDSKGFRAQLCEINGFDSEKVHEIYLPISEHIKPKENETITRKVLWASRISKDKIPEVAIEVAKILESHNVEIHFYGSMDPLYELGNKFGKMISGHKNIIYHGSYDGFHSLPLNDYDIFLLTSKNEGLPNVILEAIMANMFVVTPEVGGLPEVVAEDKNGLLVKNNFDPAAYAHQIMRFYENPQLQDVKARERTNQRILSEHNWESFVKRLQQFY